MLVFVKFNFESCCIGFGNSFFYKAKACSCFGELGSDFKCHLPCFVVFDRHFCLLHLPFGSSAFSVKECPSKDSQ